MAYTEWEILRTAVGQNSIKIVLCDDDPNILTKVRDEIERRTGKVPTVAEIAEVLDVSQELVLEAMESSHSYGTYSLNQTFDDSGEEGDSSVFEKYLGQREAGYDSFELSDMIRSVYNDLSEKEQEIFRLRFMENKTQQEIADLQGTSQMTVSRIEKKLKEKFKAAYIS